MQLELMFPSTRKELFDFDVPFWVINLGWYLAS